MFITVTMYAILFITYLTAKYIVLLTYLNGTTILDWQYILLRLLLLLLRLLCLLLLTLGIVNHLDCFRLPAILG